MGEFLSREIDLNKDVDAFLSECRVAVFQPPTVRHWILYSWVSQLEGPKAQQAPGLPAALAVCAKDVASIFLLYFFWLWLAMMSLAVHVDIDWPSLFLALLTLMSYILSHSNVGLGMPTTQPLAATLLENEGRWPGDRCVTDSGQYGTDGGRCRTNGVHIFHSSLYPPCTRTAVCNDHHLGTQCFSSH